MLPLFIKHDNLSYQLGGCLETCWWSVLYYIYHAIFCSIGVIKNKLMFSLQASIKSYLCFDPIVWYTVGVCNTQARVYSVVRGSKNYCSVYTGLYFDIIINILFILTCFPPSRYIKTVCWRPIGGLRLFSALWSCCCLFDIFPIYIYNFISWCSQFLYGRYFLLS